MPRQSPHPTNESPHTPTKAVILLHTLPDGTSHHDWLIEIPGRTDEHRLQSFRSVVRPDRTDPDIVFHVEHLPDHRAHYLTQEGDLGADRGGVVRVARGLCTRFEMGPSSDRLELAIEWTAGIGSVYHGARKSLNHWTFSRR